MLVRSGHSLCCLILWFAPRALTCTAEYWISQPKKFCDFCKCWIADNKPSVDFHERGKKHQENVKLKIQEVKKKGTERRQQQDQLQDDLAAIEAAALKAYNKDVKNSNTSTIPVVKEISTKPKLERKSNECTSVESCSVVSDINSWAAYQTPEGYWYYYNKETEESRWDPPSGFQSHHQNSEKELEERDPDEQSIKAITKDDVNTTEDTNQPFGRWETVAVYDSNENTAVKPEENSEADRKNDEQPSTKFKEKQLPTLKVKDASENVAFKKRKNNQEKKRSLRQRTDDS